MGSKESATVLFNPSLARYPLLMVRNLLISIPSLFIVCLCLLLLVPKKPLQRGIYLDFLAKGDAWMLYILLRKMHVISQSWKIYFWVNNAFNYLDLVNTTISRAYITCSTILPWGPHWDWGFFLFKYTRNSLHFKAIWGLDWYQKQLHFSPEKKRHTNLFSIWNQKIKICFCYNA